MSVLTFIALGIIISLVLLAIDAMIYHREWRENEPVL